MNILDLMLERDVLDPEFTLGKLYSAGMYFCETGEDPDRQLETYPERKINGNSAIPRGRYRITTSLSARFGKVLPELLDVPGFSGIRCHGGNGPEDTAGCLLLGRVRAARGPANCADRVQALIKVIDQVEDNGGQVWITIQ